MVPPKTYEDWLALSDEERQHVHQEIWNVYDGDGLAIAHQAAVRLATSTTMKVHGIATGIYHGGEHVLHLTVAEEDASKCPPHLQQLFEGFRVIWMSHASSLLPIEERGQVVGEWFDESDLAGLRLRIASTADGIAVSGGASASGKAVQFVGGEVNREYLLFEAVEEGRAALTQYVFHRLGVDVAECVIKSTVRMRRADEPRLG